MTEAPADTGTAVANGPDAGAAEGFEERFVGWLQECVKREDRGVLAALRRGLGKQAGEAAEMFPYVVPWVRAGAPARQEAAFYLVASLFAWHPQTWPAGRDSASRPSFGTSFARLARETESDSANRMMVALLNSHGDDLPERLRRAVGLLRSHDVPVAWAALLSDLQHWDWLSRAVQRRWAQDFWGRPDTRDSKQVADSAVPDSDGAAPLDRGIQDPEQ